MLPRLVRISWRLFLAGGCAALILLVWLAAGWPTGLDRWLDVTTTPRPSAAIVVLAAGTTGTNLPLPRGWERIETAAHLYADRMAPVVVFSGGGTARVSEAEIYANAAAWLGIPRDAMVFEPAAQRTAAHGPALLGLTLPDGRPITTDTPLLIVTSAFHSRRALRSFAKAGYSQVRVVSHHRAAIPAAGTPAALTTAIPGFTPSGRRYDDVLFRLAYRSFDFFIGLREVGAIAVESVRGR